MHPTPLGGSAFHACIKLQGLSAGMGQVGGNRAAMPWRDLCVCGASVIAEPQASMSCSQPLDHRWRGPCECSVETRTRGALDGHGPRRMGMRHGWMEDQPRAHCRVPSEACPECPRQNERVLSMRTTGAWLEGQRRESYLLVTV